MKIRTHGERESGRVADKGQEDLHSNSKAEREQNIQTYRQCKQSQHAVLHAPQRTYTGSHPVISRYSVPSTRLNPRPKINTPTSSPLSVSLHTRAAPACFSPDTHKKKPLRLLNLTPAFLSLSPSDSATTLDHRRERSRVKRC